MQSDEMKKMRDEFERQIRPFAFFDPVVKKNNKFLRLVVKGLDLTFDKAYYEAAITIFEAFEIQPSKAALRLGREWLIYSYLRNERKLTEGDIQQFSQYFSTDRKSLYEDEFVAMFYAQAHIDELEFKNIISLQDVKKALDYHYEKDPKSDRLTIILNRFYMSDSFNYAGVYALDRLKKGSLFFHKRFGNDRDVAIIFCLIVIKTLEISNHRYEDVDAGYKMLLWYYQELLVLQKGELKNSHCLLIPFGNYPCNTKLAKEYSDMVLKVFEKFKKENMMNPMFLSSFGFNMIFLGLYFDKENKSHLISEGLRLFKVSESLYPNDKETQERKARSIGHLLLSQDDEFKYSFKEVDLLFQKASIEEISEGKIFCCWGEFLQKYAKFEEDKENRRKVLERAIEKLMIAEGLGCKNIHYARVYAQLNDTRTLDQLEKELLKDYYDVQKVLDDSVWDSYRNDRKFKAIVGRYSPHV